ncbi:MAG: insulinase family protein [Clostridia bacterium]|nr:insulinase family protein [Clostridia bacterium]
MIFSQIKNEFLNEAIYKGVHKSGLNVVALPKKGFSKYYAILSTGYGSNDVCFKDDEHKEFIEIPDGIAHFLEHKMFEQPDGTNAFDKFSLYGANANAFTSFNNTAYLFQSTDFFNENLEHLLNYVFSPYFTKENVEKEQGIIGQEIRMYDDDPDWRVMFNMLKAMYSEHPIRRDIAGTVESISKIDKDLLYYCYNIFYHPQNMVLFIAGDFDVENISDILDKCVPVKEKDFNAIKKEYNEPENINKKEITDNLEVSMPIFSMGYKDNSKIILGKELAKKNLITSIIVKLFAGDSSPLYKRMYDEGLINETFYDDITINRDYSFVQFSGESPEPKKVREEILKEAKRIKEEGFNKSDFLRCKKFMYGKYIKSFNNIESIGNAFASNFFLKVDLFDFLDVYESITYDDIIERFNELFNEDMFVTSIILPKE